ncbi:MAG: SCO1664 family protein [Actinomycetota bacterium]|nr:SCO1664 family protein [Actinomycetota bacterium]
MPTDELTQQLHLLATGEVRVLGRIMWSSNATFLVDVTDPADDSSTHRAIYKPTRGERPLWDFEPGLHRRELAAYELSEAVGLGAVPATVTRDGPLGEGSLQWFVDADHEEHYFTIFEQYPDLHDQLRAIAVFDLLANNTDRKSGHCLLEGPKVWAIDHGLCFAADFKLRTVIWEFAGEPIADSLRAMAERVHTGVPDSVAALLRADEVAALRARAAELADDGVFPADHSGHRYPWPLV